MGAPSRIPVEQRFWSKVDRTGGPNACWRWTDASSDTDYARFHIRRENGRNFSDGAHRFAYRLVMGDIPEGYQIDHLCRNPICVNPLHLEPVPHRENVVRGISFAAGNNRKTHCVRGHEFNDENTFLKKGARICRTCHRLRQSGKLLPSGRKLKCVPNWGDGVGGKILKFDDLYKINLTTGCWEWQGSMQGTLPRYRAPNEKSGSALRYAYVRQYGDIERSDQVRHTCENRACVNPEHLILRSKNAGRFV